MIRATVIPVVALALCCPFLVGCGSGSEGPATVSASGTVTLNGAPLEGATVVLQPVEGNLTASAVTDTTGSFELQTPPNFSGAVPGEYKAIVKKQASIAASDVAHGQDDSNVYSNKADAAPALLTPKKYSDAATTDLTVSIPDGGNTSITLALEGEPGK